jgi:hypothetical protein
MKKWKEKCFFEKTLKGCEGFWAKRKLKEDRKKFQANLRVLNETKTRELLDTTVAVALVVVATSSSYILHEGLWYKKWIEINTLLLLHCWCFFGSFENYPLSLSPSFFFLADFCVGNQSAISSGQVNQHSAANHAPWTVVCTAKFTFSLYCYPIELTIVVTYVLTIHMHLHTEFLIVFLFWSTVQQTRPDKLLAPPSQAHWPRFGRSFTCTPLGLWLGWVEKKN